MFATYPDPGGTTHACPTQPGRGAPAGRQTGDYGGPMSPRAARRGAALTGLLLALVLTGCGDSEDSAVEAVAGDLLEATTTGDGQAACKVLSPHTRDELEQSSGKPCERAILEESIGHDGTVRDAEVFETMAQVRFDDETVFLSKFDSGWLVVATACTPRPEGPYDCSVSGV
jgi:hypothetical protein